jgi:hypothetical protein
MLHRTTAALAASFALSLVSCSSHSSSKGAPAGDAAAPVAFDDDASIPLQPWNTEASLFVDGVALDLAGAQDCRNGMCRHSENTDMIVWQGATYLVHRTAMSQILGPNSSLLVYKSTDGGETFTKIARLQAPEQPIDANDTSTTGRDLRDPCFFIVKAADGSETLHIKALTRLPVTSTRDSNVETIAVGYTSSDGATWSTPSRIGPNGWSFWRVKEVGGVFYTAAYADGDQSVSLFSSPDGATWTQGAQIYGVSADTPLETELQAVPSGKLLALVRMDGTDEELLGNDGLLRTKVCWASPPFTAWDCSNELDGERLDGPVTFMWNGRLFVVARRHYDQAPPRCRKRTALFELTGSLDGGPLAVKEWGDLPSAGDTSYAGVAFMDDHRLRVSWYSSDIPADADWLVAMLGPTSIWLGTIDMALVK